MPSPEFDENGNPIVYELSYDGSYRKGFILEEWEDENGDRIVRYESGMIRNMTKHKIIKSIDNPYIDSVTSHEMVKRRRDITAEKIRDAVSRAMFGDEITHMPTQAIGDAAGMLWTQIVMNKDAPARERINAWLNIGRHAGLLTSEKETEMQNSEGLNVSIGQNLAREIVQKLMDRKNND